MRPESIKKVEFTLDLGHINKIQAVQDHGIGENIDNVVLGWCDDKLVAVCSLAPRMALPKKFHAAFMATAALRRGFGVTSVTLLADGWWSETETEVPIAQRFADGDMSVDEALIVHCVEPEEPSIIVAQPYHVGLGRVVTLHKPTSRRLLSDSIGGVAALKKALSVDVGPIMNKDDLRNIGVTVEAVE